MVLVPRQERHAFPPPCGTRKWTWKTKEQKKETKAPKSGNNKPLSTILSTPRGPEIERERAREGNDVTLAVQRSFCFFLIDFLHAIQLSPHKPPTECGVYPRVSGVVGVEWLIFQRRIFPPLLFPSV